ncbi:MAG: TonB-dependent receptor [Gammaproteobacteria bacterium]
MDSTNQISARTRTHYPPLLSCCAVLLIGSAAPVFAAEPSNNSETASGEVEEVLVTARRREERAQDVPISITVLNSEAIRERNIESAQELSAVVPSMNASTSTVRGATSYTIRGQGATLGAGPGVVAYFAEVPLPQGNLGSVTQGGGPGLYYDLQNIQVLKGPQGTLFGRNTTGGAVLLEPQRPQDEFGGYLQTQFGNYDDREIEGAINTPLTPNLLLRVAGKYVTRDGFTHDVVTGQDYDDRNYGAARIGLLYKPNERIENYLLLNGIFSHDHGGSTVPIAINPTGRAVTLFPDGSYAANLAAQEARGPRDVSLSAPVVDREHLYSITDTFRFNINDSLTLKNILSYSRFQYLANQDSDASPLAILDTITPGNQWNTDTDNYSDEFQLQGNAQQGHLQWVAGAYVEYDKPVGVQTQWTAQFLGSPLVSPTGAVQSQEYKETRNSHALFVQGTYNLGGLAAALEGLNLTAGYRYTWDKRDNTTDAALPLQNFACTSFPGLFRPDCTLAVTQRSQAPTWTAGLDFKVTPDALVYAKYSRGYKTGGSNPTSIDPAALTFRPEYVEDVEVGLKSDWNWNGVRAQFNVDVFHDDYSDIQRTGAVFFAGKTGSATINAAQATIRGAEVEASLFPVESLQLLATYSYLDAQYDRFILGTTDLSNEPFAFAPRNKYSFTTRYSLPLSDQLGTFRASATYSHTDQWYIGVTSIEASAWVPGYSLIDVRAGLEGVAGRPLDITLFASNLANKEFRIGSTAYYNTLGYAQAVYGEPRMYGVQLNYRFGAR